MLKIEKKNNKLQMKQLKNYKLKLKNKQKIQMNWITLIILPYRVNQKKKLIINHNKKEI